MVFFYIKLMLIATYHLKVIPICCKLVFYKNIKNETNVQYLYTIYF